MKKEFDTPCPDFFEDKVKCDECKHWIDKYDASSVDAGYNMWLGLTILWYCPMHKKPYSRFISAQPENLYFGEVQMDKDGTPIGYEKIKEKKV